MVDINTSYDLFGRSQTDITLTVQDALAEMRYEYALFLLLSGLFLLGYVLFNNFVSAKTVSGTVKLAKVKSTVDEYAIMPALFIVIVAISYFTGFEGT